MPSSRTTFFEDIQVVPQFEHLRSVLLQEEYRLHLNKPLAFWALPTDRRLPLAFMNRSLGDLLNTSFDELCHTPSIGEKKIRSLLKLLGRVAQTKEENLPKWETFVPNEEPQMDVTSRQFDVSTISELQWQNWQQTILKHGLDKEKLGRLCLSLTELTRVIWNRILGNYCNKTLAEMREIRTHGEKRVTAILSVFHNIHTILQNVEISDRLQLRLTPKNIDQVEQWALQTIVKKGVPAAGEMKKHYTKPLLDQLRQDATEQIVELAANRIGLHGEVTSVRQTARTLGLARARVYQLLNEINDILMVRWPNGALLTSLLRNKFLKDAKNLRNTEELDHFHAAAELFFPWGRRENVGETFFGMLDIEQEFSDDFPQEQTELSVEKAK